MKQNKLTKNEKMREAEANARRMVCKKWQREERKNGYQQASLRALYATTAAKIEDEVLDGIFLNLNKRNQTKSARAKDRLLRRIVEKRQAQANHRKYGRSEDLSSVYITALFTKQTMESIYRRRHAA